MFDVEKFLRDFSIPTNTEGANTHEGWIQICCPFCNDDNWHGGFNLSSGKYNCWKCHYHSIEAVVKEILGISWKRAKYICKEYGIDDNSVHIKKEKFIGAKELILPKNFVPLFGQYKRYLEKRNFDPDKLEKEFDLKASGNLGGDRFRIIAPIFLKKILVSYQGRDITDLSDMRYKACSKKKEVIHHKHIIYNSDHCYREEGICLEGVADVWRIGDNSFCTFGTEFTLNQVVFIKERFKKVFLIYDPEFHATEQAQNLGHMLSLMNVKTELIELPDGKDPAELSQDDANYLKKELLG